MVANPKKEILFASFGLSLMALYAVLETIQITGGGSSEWLNNHGSSTVGAAAIAHGANSSLSIASLVFSSIKGFSKYPAIGGAIGLGIILGKEFHDAEEYGNGFDYADLAYGSAAIGTYVAAAKTIGPKYH